MRKLMKLYKLNFKSITAIISVTPAILIFSLLSNLTYANEDDTALKKKCNRQSLITVAKIRNNSSNELTEQDIRMLRLGANHACMEIHKRLVNSNNNPPPDSKVIAKTDDAKNQENDDDKNESIFDRLLRTEKREDVNPMQKRHRTGGK